MTANVLVVGGGVSGLSLAWSLAERGHAVEVWEATDRIGGKIRTTREQGFLTERAASLIMNHRNEVDAMIGALGLSAEKCVRARNLKRYILKDDQLQQVPMQFVGLLCSSLWRSRTKWRLMAEPLMPRARDPAESAACFIRRRFGEEVLHTVFDPFISATLASDPELAEARAVLPRLKALEARYGSIGAGILVNLLWHKRRPNQAESFSFTQGMHTLPQTLAAHPRITVRTGIRVQAVERASDHWRVFAEKAGVPQQRQVPELVLSTPAAVAAKLLHDSDAGLADLLRGIVYCPIAIVHMGVARQQVQHPLDGTGFLAGRQSGLGLRGNLWMHRLFAGRAPHGHALLSTYINGARVFENDDALVGHITRELAPLIGLRGEPVYCRIDRHRRGLPLYHGRYTARCEAIAERARALGHLHLHANYLQGVSVRERLFQSLTLARQLSGVLQAEGEPCNEAGRLALSTP